MAADHAEGAGALLVTTFQIAIATGAIVGGFLVDMSGSPGAIFHSGAAALVAGLIMLAFNRSGDTERPENQRRRRRLS